MKQQHLTIKGNINGFLIRGDGSLDFELLCERYFVNKSGEKQKETLIFNCDARGEFATKAYADFKLGREVEVSGVLRKTPEIYISCEKISFPWKNYSKNQEYKNNKPEIEIER